MGRLVEFDDGITLRIAQSVMNEISSLIASRGLNTESGGILLGTQASDAQRFEITMASMPSVLDVSRRYSFLRRMSPANKLIANSWDNSTGTVNYLGEWHTHNEPNPTPSATDRSLMLQVVKDGSCLLDRAFMLIVGNSGKAYVGAVNPHNERGIYSERWFRWVR